jgi:hypothetical protein
VNQWIDATGFDSSNDRVAFSERIRMALLETHGGVWADATVYCRRPLDSWLPARMGEGFFAFSKPAPARMVSSWFLAAHTDALLLRQWGQAVRSYWAEHDSKHHYFWLHREFGNCYRRSIEFRRAWDRVPKLSADGPHYFAPYGDRFMRQMSMRAKARLSYGDEPLFKLSHHVSGEAAEAGSAYFYLVNGSSLDETPSRFWWALDRSCEPIRQRMLHAWEGALESGRWAKAHLNR